MAINKQLNRWNSYVLIKDEDIPNFLTSLYSSKKGNKSLYILGKGFDKRMNLGVKRLLSTPEEKEIDVLLLTFKEGKNSPSWKYKNKIEENYAELNTLISGRNLINKEIKIWDKDGRGKRRVGAREAAGVIELKDIKNYDNIFLDISALPRSVYFSLAGKILSLIDGYQKGESKSNFFIITAENAELDSIIREKELDDELEYLPRFLGGSGMESYSNKPKIWLPLVGEGKKAHFEKANQFIKPDEICPLFPFPSKNPRRSDDIFMEHHSLFFDSLGIEPQNMMYVPEQNPFEVYKKLVSTVQNYNMALSELQGCNAIISNFSSKLISIGALLAAYESKKSDLKIGILNVDANGYEIDNIKKMENSATESKLFVTWLTGVPYIK